MRGKSRRILTPLAMLLTVAIGGTCTQTALAAPEHAEQPTETQRAVKGSALIRKGRLGNYRSLLPSAVAELVERDELAFEVSSSIRGAWSTVAPLESPPAGLVVDGKGSLTPPMVSAAGLLFSRASIEDESLDATARAYRILWNTTVHQWRLRSFVASMSLTSFVAGTQEGARVELGVSRLYPPAFGQSPGTLKPIFREKLSAQQPEALKGLTWLTLRFHGAAVPDYLWASSPVTGKVRQLTGSNRADQLFNGGVSPDELFVWSGKVEGVQPSTVEKEKLLVAVLEGEPAVAPASGEVCAVTDFSRAAPLELNLSSERFEGMPPWVPTNIRMVQRDVWKIEMNSRDPFSLDARQTLYVDAATFAPVYRVVWGEDGRTKNVIVGVMGSVPTREGTGFGWRGEVLFSSTSSTRSVLTLQRLESCAQILPGRAVVDFDPSSIGAKKNKSAGGKAVPTPASVVQFEPVDE